MDHHLMDDNKKTFIHGKRTQIFIKRLREI